MALSFLVFRELISIGWQSKQISLYFCHSHVETTHCRTYKFSFCLFFPPFMMLCCRMLGCLFAAATAVLAALQHSTTAEENNVFLTNDVVTLKYHPTLSSNVITTLYPKTQVSIRCRVSDPTNAVNGDPWWLYVDVPSTGNTGWLTDWYVECGGNCPGSICT